jgi:hyaluronoglucosaminidase
VLAFCGRHGLNTYVYAPKDDPFHRVRWRDPYPDEQLAQFAELVRVADEHDMELIYALAPGLSVRYSEPAEVDALAAKAEQLRSAGVRTFHLLFDDIEPVLSPEDGAVFESIGAAHAALTNAFLESYVARLDDARPLAMCPMGYAGNGLTPYREALTATLDERVLVYWTGPEVVPATITRGDLEAASAAFDGRELLLWDNYPVNDFAPEKLFLGPLRGRDPELANGPLAGLLANPMVQAVPSKLALATVADFVADPAAYDPDDSFVAALREVGREVIDAL